MHRWSQAQSLMPVAVAAEDPRLAGWPAEGFNCEACGFSRTRSAPAAASYQDRSSVARKLILHSASRTSPATRVASRSKGLTELPCPPHVRTRSFDLVNFVHWIRKRLVDLGTEKAPGTKLAKSNFQLPNFQLPVSENGGSCLLESAVLKRTGDF